MVYTCSLFFPFHTAEIAYLVNFFNFFQKILGRKQGWFTVALCFCRFVRLKTGKVEKDFENLENFKSNDLIGWLARSGDRTRSKRLGRTGLSMV